MPTIEHELRDAHRVQIEQMLRATTSLDQPEVDVALELIDLELAEPGRSGYEFLLARTPEGLAGYLCYGPTPMTEGTFDLYWLVTHPDQRRRGVARALVLAMEERLRAAGARLVRVETSSQEGYGAARRFYRACAYDEAAVLREFYRPGDDLIIFTKSFTPRSANGGRTAGDGVEAGDEQAAEARLAAGAAALGDDADDFEAVYEIAFSYRDFEFERDFLRTCAITHGRGDPQRVLEWACGPSRHLQSFASLGRGSASGAVECIGVDLSPAMLDLARRRLGSGPAVTIERGDMREHVVTPAVDLAFTMLSSIHVLASPDDMRAHLQTCAESLRPGGVYVIEATHPRDLGPDGVASTRWVQRHGEAHVTASFSLDLEGGVGRTIPAVLELRHQRGDRQREYRVKMSWWVPTIAQWQALVAEVPSLELVALYGDFDVQTSASSVAAWRLILVLRRRPDGAASPD